MRACESLRRFLDGCADRVPRKNVTALVNPLRIALEGKLEKEETGSWCQTWLNMAKKFHLPKAVQEPRDGHLLQLKAR